jgi:hypothetical protein
MTTDSIACAVSGLPSPLPVLSSARDFSASANAAECSIVAFGSTRALSLFPLLDTQLSSNIDLIDSSARVITTQSFRRAGATGTANSTHLFVAGGMTHDNLTFTAALEIFSCATRLVVSDSLRVVRGFLSSFTTADGALSLFAGGFNGTHCLSTVEILDHRLGVWSLRALSAPRRSLSVGGIGEFVVLVGGDDINSTSTAVDVFNARLRIMSQTFELNKPRMNMGVTRLGGQLLMAGGESRSDARFPNRLDVVHGDVVAFGVSSGIVTMTLSAGFLAQARSRIAAATIGDQFAVFVGGVTSDLMPVATIDVYDGAAWFNVRGIGPIANAHALQLSSNIANFVGVAVASPLSMHAIQCRLVPGNTTSTPAPITISRITRDTRSIQPLPTDPMTTAEPTQPDSVTTLMIAVSDGMTLAPIPATTTTTTATATTASMTTTTSTFFAATPPESSSLPVIIGASVGGVVFLAAVAALVIYLLRRRRSMRPAANSDDHGTPAIALKESRSTSTAYSALPMRPSDVNLANPQYLNASDSDLPTFALPIQSTDYAAIPQAAKH